MGKVFGNPSWVRRLVKVEVLMRPEDATTPESADRIAREWVLAAFGAHLAGNRGVAGFRVETPGKRAPTPIGTEPHDATQRR